MATLGVVAGGVLLAPRLQPADVSADPPSSTPTPSPSATTPPARAKSAYDDLVAKPVPGVVLKAKPEAKKPKEPKDGDKNLRDKAEGVAKSGPFTFRMGSFNVLGSQHTRKGGEKPKYASGETRAGWTAQLMSQHGVDVLGTQELQDDQLRWLQNRTGMAAYPALALGAKETDNSIFYDSGMFEFVSGDAFYAPFMGRSRPQTILRLRHKASGGEAYFVNMHTSAGGLEGERDRAENIAIGVINDLKSRGIPVFVTGDMNDREDFYCHVGPATGLASANGGTANGGCKPPPRPVAVDWILGGPSVGFDNYWRDDSKLVNKTSDHFFVSATASVS